jgi:hypothetical protein
VAQDRDQWRALVDTVMNLLVPYKLQYFFNSWQILASQEGSFHEIILLSNEIWTKTNKYTVEVQILLE